MLPDLTPERVPWNLPASRRWLTVIEVQDDWGCFAYVPIAGPAGQCRYPWPVIELVHELLPCGVSIRLDADYKEREMEEGAEETIEAGEVDSWVFEIFVVQETIWHKLIWRAFEICPVELLPPELLEMRLTSDLGL